MIRFPVFKISLTLTLLLGVAYAVCGGLTLALGTLATGTVTIWAAVFENDSPESRP
jgi:hypothetical protein